MGHQAYRTVFGIAEHHAAAVFFPLQQGNQRFDPLPAAAPDAVLGDEGTALRHRRHHQLHRFQLVQPADIHHFPGNGGRKH